MENINLGVKKNQVIIDRFYELTAKCGDASIQEDEMDKIMNELTDIQNKIDAGTSLDS